MLCWPQVGVTNDLGGAGECGARSCVVKSADQPACADEVLVAEDDHRVVHLVRAGVHAALDVAQDLAALLVDPEEPRCSLEADGLEMTEEGVDERGVFVQWAPNGVAHTDDAQAAGTAG